MGLTFQATPGYYGAEQVAERAAANFELPYQPFPKTETRVAPLSPLQQQAFGQASQAAGNPQFAQNYQQSVGNVKNAAGQNILPQLQPYLEGATQNPVINAQQYMNPYQDQVISDIGKYGARALHENILPGIRDKFIGAGQYGSTGHQGLTGRAIRDTQEAISKAQSEALQSGYNKALETSVGQQGAQLRGGQFLGEAAEKGLGRQIMGGETAAKLGMLQQGNELANATALQNLGQQERQREQDIANVRYKEWQNEQAYPHEQLARYAEIVKGLPSQTHMQYKSEGSPISPPGLSPYTRGAGALMGLSGIAGQQGGFASGGHVKMPSNSMLSRPHDPIANPRNSMLTSHQPYHQTRPYIAPKMTNIRHFADGGQALNPIQRGANDAMETAEMRAYREHAQKMANPQGSPIWQAIARAGANIAGSQAKTTGEALGQGFEAGSNEYQNVLGQREAGKLESAKMMKLIHDTRQAQEEKQREHDLRIEQHKETSRHNKASEGLMASKNAREMAEHEREMKFVKGPDGMLYEVDKDEEGKTIFRSPEGQLPKQSKAGKDMYSKSNELAIEEARKSLSNLPALKSNLKELKTIAEKLDTGPTKGRIAKMSSTAGSILGVGKAEDIDNFDALTNQLVLDLGNQLKGSQIALGKLKIIENSKPQLNKVKGGNLEIINHMTDLANLSEEKSRFLMKSLKSNVNALDAEAAFNKYADAKLEYEESGKKFPNSPEDFLEAEEFEETYGKSNAENPKLESMSEEELRKIAGE